MHRHPSHLFRGASLAAGGPGRRSRAIDGEFLGRSSYEELGGSSAEAEHKRASASKTQAQEEAPNILDDIERVADRNIMRIFGKSLPPSAIDVMLSDGKTMRQQMVLGRQELLASGRVRAGSFYFGALKKRYLADMTRKPLATVENYKENLPLGLAEAIDAARARQRLDRKREPLMHWLWQHKAALNQRAAVDVVDLLVETQVARCVKQATLVFEVFSAFERLGMIDTRKVELAVIKPNLEESLQTLYATESKKDGG